MAEHESAPITSRPPLVDVTGERGTPPGIVYIGRDDKLYVRSSATTGTATFTLSGRLLQPDGVIRPFSFSVVGGANFGFVTREFQLAEGFLLSIAVEPSGVNPVPMDTVVEVGIFRGRLVDRQFVQVLFRDFVSDGFAAGWPPGRIAPVLEAPGNPRPVAGVDPAAGAEMSIAVPTNSLREHRAVRVELVTDATAANRQVQLELVNVVTVWRSEAFDAQTASLSRFYNWCVGGEFSAAPALGNYNGYIPALILSAGGLLRTVTAQLQAGDNYGAPSFLPYTWLQD